MKIPQQLQHPDLKRFGKYGIVGVSSFIVGMFVFNVLYFTTHLFLLATATSYVLSVVNGFVFNRTWTFREKRGESHWVQFSKFTAVNLLGYCLNTAILVTLLALYTHRINPAATVSVWQTALAVMLKRSGPRYSVLVINSMGVLATAIVTVWNFLTNRAWTFRH